MKPQVENSRVVSEGTLKTDDLLEAFADELYDRAMEVLESSGCDQDDYKQAGIHCSLVGEARAWVRHLRESEDRSIEELDLLTDIEDALNGYCAEHIYFGTHEGDGACFGYWLVEEEAPLAVDEIPAFLRKQAS